MAETSGLRHIEKALGHQMPKNPTVIFPKPHPNQVSNHHLSHTIQQGKTKTSDVESPYSVLPNIKYY